MYKQLYDYMKEPLNQSRCSFCKAHLTQHAPFKLLLLWQKEFGSRKSLLLFRWRFWKAVIVYHRTLWLQNWCLRLDKERLHVNVFNDDIFLVEISDLFNFIITFCIFMTAVNLWFWVTVEHVMNKNLIWFNINSFEVNPDKFQPIILRKKKNYFQYNRKVRSTNLEESDQVELLRITVDEALNFRKHIEKLLLRQHKFHALREIRK